MKLCKDGKQLLERFEEQRKNNDDYLFEMTQSNWLWHFKTCPKCSKYYKK